MKCIFQDNPGCGFIKEHTSLTCIFNHTPPQPPTHHINIGSWCSLVCELCATLDKINGEYTVKGRHPGAKIEKLPPWLLPRKVHPWELGMELPE